MIHMERTCLVGELDPVAAAVAPTGVALRAGRKGDRRLGSIANSPHFLTPGTNLGPWTWTEGKTEHFGASRPRRMS